MSTLTNISKNSGTSSNILLNCGFLLRENSGIILRENSGIILRENGNQLTKEETDCDLVSISKNSGSLTSINKN